MIWFLTVSTVLQYSGAPLFSSNKLEDLKRWQGLGVGLLDTSVKQNLQLVDSLTLNKVVDIARQHKLV